MDCLCILWQWLAGGRPNEPAIRLLIAPKMSALAPRLTRNRQRLAWHELLFVFNAYFILHDEPSFWNATSDRSFISPFDGKEQYRQLISSCMKCVYSGPPFTRRTKLWVKLPLLVAHARRDPSTVP